MNSAPASADSPAPPMPSVKIARTTMAFLTRLSLSAPQDCARANGHKRRVFNNPVGDKVMGLSLREKEAGLMAGRASTWLRCHPRIRAFDRTTFQTVVQAGGCAGWTV